MSLAKSLPPKPKAKPPAMANMATIPVNNVVNNPVAIFNWTKAEIKANTKM